MPVHEFGGMQKRRCGINELNEQHLYADQNIAAFV